jgi:hypothetical protein
MMNLGGEGSLRFMEHRGVRYEIKIAVGRSQWTWTAHTPPKPLEGSIGGAKRDAILAAEKAIDRWWAKRLRTMRLQAGASMLT